MAAPGKFRRMKERENKLSNLKKLGRSGAVMRWKEVGKTSGRARQVQVRYDPNPKSGLNRRSNENYAVGFIRNGEFNTIGRDSYFSRKEDARKEAVQYMKDISG